LMVTIGQQPAAGIAKGPIVWKEMMEVEWTPRPNFLLLHQFSSQFSVLWIWIPLVPPLHCNFLPFPSATPRFVKNFKKFCWRVSKTASTY
jgi:hypothetical protein